MSRRYKSSRRRYQSSHRGSGRNGALEHVRQYRALVDRLGPIVTDVKSALFGLSPTLRARFFEDYRGLYGDKAADYASDAFPRWESGETKMSGQTAERLLNLVPRYLTQDQRFEMVRRLCEHHRKKLYRSIQIDPKQPEGCIPEIKRALNELNEQGDFSHLPEAVIETVTWLHDADAVAARALLAEIDRRKKLATIESIARQWPDIEALLSQESVKDYKEDFVFPSGTLHLYAERSSSCFVATVVYQDANHPNVIALRGFRDTILKKSVWGRIAIGAYGFFGPTCARLAERLPFLAYGCRLVLDQLVIRAFIWGGTRERPKG